MKISTIKGAFLMLGNSIPSPLKTLNPSVTFSPICAIVYSIKNFVENGRITIRIKACFWQVKQVLSVYSAGTENFNGE